MSLQRIHEVYTVSDSVNLSTSLSLSLYSSFFVFVFFIHFCIAVIISFQKMHGFGGSGPN